MSLRFLSLPPSLPLSLSLSLSLSCRHVRVRVLKVLLVGFSFSLDTIYEQINAYTNGASSDAARAGFFLALALAVLEIVLIGKQVVNVYSMMDKMRGSDERRTSSVVARRSVLSSVAGQARRSMRSTLPADRLQARLRFTTKRFNAASPGWAFVVIGRQTALWFATVLPTPVAVAATCTDDAAGNATSLQDSTFSSSSSSAAGTNMSTALPAVAAAAAAGSNSASTLLAMSASANSSSAGVDCTGMIGVDDGYTYAIESVLASAFAALVVISMSWVAHQRQQPYVYPFQNSVEFFFFATTFTIVLLGACYSCFTAWNAHAVWYSAVRLALEVIIILILAASTAIGILVMCRGYKKHGWVRARGLIDITVKEITRRRTRQRSRRATHSVVTVDTPCNASMRSSAGSEPGQSEAAQKPRWIGRMRRMQAGVRRVVNSALGYGVATEQISPEATKSRRRSSIDEEHEVHAI